MSLAEAQLIYHIRECMREFYKDPENLKAFEAWKEMRATPNQENRAQSETGQPHFSTSVTP